MKKENNINQAGIKAAAYCLPGNPIDIRDWALQENVTNDLVERLIANGCRYFYIGCEKSDVELISNALDKLFAEEKIDKSKIGYLLHAHTQNFSIPAPPHSILNEVAEHYELNPKLSFSVSQLACASVINAIMWASELLEDDEEFEYALVVTSDRVFGKAKHRIRQDAGIQSDGASAILIAKSDVRCRIANIGIKNFAKLYEGPATPALAAAISRYTWIHTKQLLTEMHEGNDISLRDYGAILPVNADAKYWQLIAKSLNLPESIFYLRNIANRGHACCSDFAINLVDYGLSKINEGLPILSCGQSNVGAHAAISLVPVVEHLKTSFRSGGSTLNITLNEEVCV